MFEKLYLPQALLCRPFAFIRPAQVLAFFRYYFIAGLPLFDHVPLLRRILRGRVRMSIHEVPYNAIEFEKTILEWNFDKAGFAANQPVKNLNSLFA
jgi:hypothetical protein